MKRNLIISSHITLTVSFCLLSCIIGVILVLTQSKNGYTDLKEITTEHNTYKCWKTMYSIGFIGSFILVFLVIIFIILFVYLIKRIKQDFIEISFHYNIVSYLTLSLFVIPMLIVDFSFLLYNIGYISQIVNKECEQKLQSIHQSRMIHMIISSFFIGIPGLLLFFICLRLKRKIVFLNK